MFPEILNDICRLSHLAIIGEIKRSKGLGITELAQILDMSYMGVKAHCIKLEKQGYISGWREPRGANMGRPRKLFMLTEKCDPLFPDGGDELLLELLEGVKTSFGEAAPEKLLYHYFEKKQDQWVKVITSAKSVVEKATLFADFRIESGHFCNYEHVEAEGFIIEEYHHPLHKIFDRYPSLIVLELRMMEQVLGAKVERNVKKGDQGNVFCTVYKISTL
ncbi:MAG: helix-turn-helix transcriptional regulator [Akkermansiaceae bacterium]